MNRRTAPLTSNYERDTIAWKQGRPRDFNGPPLQRPSPWLRLLPFRLSA